MYNIYSSIRFVLTKGFNPKYRRNKTKRNKDLEICDSSNLFLQQQLVSTTIYIPN